MKKTIKRKSSSIERIATKLEETKLKSTFTGATAQSSAMEFTLVEAKRVKSKSPRFNPSPNLIPRNKKNNQDTDNISVVSTGSTDSNQMEEENEVTKGKTRKNNQIVRKGTMQPLKNKNIQDYMSNNKFKIFQTPQSFNNTSLEENNAALEAIRKKNENPKHSLRATTGSPNTRDSPSSNKTTQPTVSTSAAPPAPPPGDRRTTDNLPASPTDPRQVPTEKTRPPPINIINQDPRDTVQLIKHNIGISNFHIKLIHNNKHVLYLDNLQDFTKAKEILISAQTSFFTFTHKLEKFQTYLLKGLDNNFSENDILSELRDLQISDVEFTKVSRFTTKKSIANNVQLPIYMVQISPQSSISKLLNIKFLFYYKISWEKIRKNDITQCHRCQLIGHTSQNCNMAYRCVKCNEQHEPGQCKILKTENIDKNKIFCVNCKEFGHPASYRGCPKIVVFSVVWPLAGVQFHFLLIQS